MNGPEQWLNDWRKAGALSLSRHDPAKEGITVSAFLPAAALISSAEKLGQAGYTLLDISALEALEGLVVTYHFDSFKEPGRLALRVLVSPRKPALPSLYSVFQGAEWHEREAADFFGLVFENNPNLIPLLLPDDLPGPPPLRKKNGALSPISKLGLLGQAEIIDPGFGAACGLGE
ncbi:MAG: NADH-quinone oxidoreductase subunit C [Deltaproteobacteria bacterium]|jgi:NADH-quinone oxidoreductase subunit C|nr:NADH-quinone oxidoreductase subunit C [Deltaproteobacteria bacterium]